MVPVAAPNPIGKRQPGRRSALCRFVGAGQSLWDRTIPRRRASDDSEFDSSRLSWGHGSPHCCMIRRLASPPVSDDERLARFILFRNRIRSDQTVKPDAFIPHPYPNLSVTRHLGLTESELWEIGQEVADSRPATLYGRADVRGSTFTRQSLTLSPTAKPRNHVNVGGWPSDKPSQKIIAQQIAAVAAFVPKA